MKDKISSDFKFTEEERERWLKKYFMKYFMEDMKTDTLKQKIAIGGEESPAKRDCACPEGGDNADKKQRFMTVKMQPEVATREMKDAQLGFSKGLKSKWNPAKLNDDLEDIMGKRHRRIEKK